VLPIEALLQKFLCMYGVMLRTEVIAGAIMQGAVTHHDGGCLCGALRFRVTALPLDSGYCHCRMCQRNSGAPVVAWVTFPATSFAWISGVPGTFASSSHGKRQFCSHCGSYLVFLSAKSPAEVSVNTASFDDPGAYPPKKHIYSESRIPWFRTDDGLPNYLGNDGSQLVDSNE
jgi:hypothetical protein